MEQRQLKDQLMEIRHMLSLDDLRVNVGEWDWEAYEAHKRGTTEITQADIMAILKRQDQVERLQQEARDDAMLNARRLCVVVDNFLPECECDELLSQLRPLLRPTKSYSLQNLVINYSHDGTPSSEDEAAVKLLTSISERLWARLNELDSPSQGRSSHALLRQIQTAPRWSCRDYHVRHAEQGGVDGEMEMRLRAMSDHVRVMRYSATETGGAQSTGDNHEDGDFPTDPRNAHHDGRN